MLNCWWRRSSSLRLFCLCVLLSTLKIVVRVLSLSLFVLFSRWYLRKTDVAKITKLDIEMFHHESWKPFYYWPICTFGVRLVTVAGVVGVCNTTHMQCNSPGGSTWRASSVTSRSSDVLTLIIRWLKMLTDWLQPAVAVWSCLGSYKYSVWHICSNTSCRSVRLVDLYFFFTWPHQEVNLTPLLGSPSYLVQLKSTTHRVLRVNWSAPTCCITSLGTPR